jgi:hypothetical protein
LSGLQPPDVLFSGDKGTLMIRHSSYTLYEPDGQVRQQVSGSAADSVHVHNFLQAIRGKERLNSDIVEGHTSTVLCHLGNISHRVGRALRCDGSNGHIVGDQEAEQLWSREYAPGWEPKLR